jgi:predicted nucleotidyltransferase component of viral defense system
MALKIAVHRNVLFQILKDIYSDTSLGPCLGFKGGTAALTFYGLDRFSIDLDFDLLNESKEDEVFTKIKKIVQKYGVLKDARQKRFTLFFLLSYSSGERLLKVEVNRRKSEAIYELKNYLGVAVLVMRQEDMFANKLLAMKERMGRANRDIYDTHFFLKANWPINQNLVEQRTGQPFQQVIRQLIAALEKVDNRHILDGIGELLTLPQKDWVRAKLVAETIVFLKLYL